MIDAYIKTVHRLMDWLGAIAASLLILLVMIMAYNVIARYAFNASSLGLEELSWHFYAAIFLLGIPYALRHGSHVRVDLVYERLQPRRQAWIDLVGSLLFLLPFCVVVVWAGWNFTAAAYQLGNQPDSVAQFFSQLVGSGIGEKSQDPGGLLNRWIIKGVIPLSFVCLTIASSAFILERCQILRGQLALDSHSEDSPPEDLGGIG